MSVLKWDARVGDDVHHVELTRGPAGAVTASVDGRTYALSLTEPQPLVYSILSDDGSSHEAIVQLRQGKCRVRIGRRVFDVLPEEPGRDSVRSAGAMREASGKSAVRAAMPGRVLRVLVTAGQKVSARQGLLVLEAMKMENEVTAPRDGVVSELKVAQGATVENGDLLVVLE